MRLRADRRAVGPPDFVGVGAYRSATAAWWARLVEHPTIVRSERPPGVPRHFFDEFSTREMQAADIERYHRRFPRPAGAITGEWRPRYMYNPWTPMLLRRAAPDAKLLVLLGDPIWRYRVNLAAELALNREHDHERYMPDVAGRARYATQLRRLLEWYPREQVLVLQHERCRLDPVGQYLRTLAFLGIDDGFVPARLRRWSTEWDDRDLRFPTTAETAKRKLVQTLRRRRDTEPPALWPALEAALHEELDPEIAELQQLVPDLDFSLWPSFSPGTRTRAA